MDEDEALALSEDENEDEIRCARSLELGYKPQKEAELNFLLPNNKELDEESSQLLEEIKSYLGRAVMLREMKPACSVWTSRLIKYIRLYGLKFSKEDHINFVKLVYELILIPDLEPTKLHKFSTLFTMLTKRRYLISPDELTLPWRPLYDLAIKLFYKSAIHIGMVHYMASLESMCESVVKCAQPYFGKSATKEILEELLPQIVPWDKYNGVLDLLVLFLPTGLKAEYSDVGFKLWIDDMLVLWNTCVNSPVIGDLFPLFSALAKRSPGLVDWSPHVPLMFGRFIHSFSLPVSYKNNQPLQTHSLEVNQMANWIVWGMSRDGVMLHHLKSFLSGIESYLHTANTGRWSFRLKDFLRKLARAFIFRVHRERHSKFQQTWENQSPPNFALRDQDIDEFVQIMLEPALLVVHSRFGFTESGQTLHCLATLRPGVVIPPLLNQLYSALESLTEPHRVTAAMQAIVAIARPLIRGAAAGYPEGPTHIVPILMASLPGLDPNDIRKTMVTLSLIAMFGSMVTFIDCSNASEYWPDMTEEERIVCESTAQFEDFVLMFFDKLFVIIESTSLEAVRMETRDSESSRTKQDQLLEAGIVSASNVVLTQSSSKIISEALRKFKAFATGASFETQVSGRHIAWVLRSFLRADPKATMKAFVPYICDELNELLQSEEDDNPPRELLYHLLLLSHVVNDVHISEYFDVVLPVLDKAIKLSSRKAYTLACETLARTIGPFGTTYVNDMKSCPFDFEEAPQKWLPVREWGVGYPLKSTKFDWHTPGKEDAEVIEMLLKRYAFPEVETLQLWLDENREISKEARIRGLNIIHASMACLVLMPPLDEPQVQLVHSALPSTPFYLRDGYCRRIDWLGQDLRRCIIKICGDVQGRLLREKSDDTRSLEAIINIWECLSVEGRSWRSAIGPLVGSDEVGCGNSHTRMMVSSAERLLDARGGPQPGSARLRLTLADGATLLQQVRVDMRSDDGLNESKIKIMHALLDLSVYTYTEVRIRSQMRLQWMLGHHAYSCKAVLPKIVAMLSEPSQDLSEEEAHAQLKGLLCLVCGGRTTPLVAKQDWEVAGALWPAILRAPLSEKPSIVRLEQTFMDTISRHFPTVNTKIEMTAGCVSAAEAIVPKEDLGDPIFVQNLKEAVENERAAMELTEGQYVGLMEELVAIAETPSTMWRRALYATNLISLSPSLQTDYPPSVARLSVHSLIHDNLLVRKIAVKMLIFVLKQSKQRIVKVKIDPFQAAGVPRPDKIIPGYRPDNKWVRYSAENVPTTDEEWEKPWAKKNMGFFSWPSLIEVYAASSEQPDPERAADRMTESQRVVLEFFGDDANVDRFVAFASAEDKKGKDKFSGMRFTMYKILFRAYGIPIASKFLTRALALASDPHEACQRFAAEVASSALRATKHWTRPRALEIFESVTKIFRVGLQSVTPESADDWGTCLATAAENLEPNRAAAVIHAWMQMCIPQPVSGDDADADKDSSFGMAARLLALQGALSALSWRGAELCSEFVSRLQEARFIQHPYQNVRERVGSVLMTAFDLDVVFPGGEHGLAPRYSDLLKDTLPKLAPLYDKHGEIIVQTRAAWAPTARCDAAAPFSVPHSALPRSELQEVSVASSSLGDAMCKNASDGEGRECWKLARSSMVERDLAARLDGGLRLCGEDSGAGPHEHARAVNLLITLIRGTAGSLARGIRGASAEHYSLLHATCALSARAPPAAHDELARAADSYLACLAIMYHDERLFDVALEQIEKVCRSRSWWARLSAVQFAQALLFYALPLLRASAERAKRAELIALDNMSDARLEVRTAAAKLLTGLMHCSALVDEPKTLKSLLASCQSKELIERHRGVLGLCGYVSSRPYTIAPNLGGVLSELLRHTNAPDPLPATIRSALADFKRTHQDDWQRHRETLTEDELDLLTDLTAPPAYCA